MGDVVEFKPYVPVIEQLRARLDELPDWCREGVAHLITMADVGALICRRRGEALAAIRKILDAPESYASTDEEVNNG